MFTNRLNNWFPETDDKWIQLFAQAQELSGRRALRSPCGVDGVGPTGAPLHALDLGNKQGTSKDKENE